MRPIFTIAWKDLRNLITSPLFYVISGLCTAVWSLVYISTFFEFVNQASAFLQPGIESGLNIQRNVFLKHIWVTNYLYFFVIPAFTMRLLAEEKRQGTYDLLMTSPITATQIAIGKFLAGVGAVALLTFFSFLYPLGTRLVGEFPLGPLLIAYLGVMLVSSAYVAIGLFASSLTESVLLSVVLGVVFNLVFWLIGQGGGMGSSMISEVLDYMSLGPHYVGFLLGSIKVNSLVFVLSLIAIFVFFTQRVVESSRWR